MRLGAVRIVADWLKDDTSGYAAVLAALPLDGSDTRPTTVADSRILDETRDANAAFGRFDGLFTPSNTSPVLMVSCTDVVYDPAIPIQVGAYAEAMVTVVVRYAQRKVGAAANMADGNYATLAILGSLRALFLNDNVASRQRNGVELVMAEGLREQGLYQEVDDAWLLAGVELRAQARTIYPMGS